MIMNKGLFFTMCFLVYVLMQMASTTMKNVQSDEPTWQETATIATLAEHPRMK